MIKETVPESVIGIVVQILLTTDEKKIIFFSSLFSSHGSVAICLFFLIKSYMFSF